MIEYVGKLPDGKVVDSNLSSDSSPIEIEAGGISEMEGLSQGILGMCCGEKRRLTIPSSMAFGVVGADTIPPNCDLIYEVKLLARDDDPFGRPAIRIEDIRKGKGSTAKAGMDATFHWKAWLANGRQITDLKLKNPATITLTDSGHEGLEEMIKGMRPGGVRRAVVRDFSFAAVGFGYSRVLVEVTLDRLGPSKKLSGNPG